MTYHSLIDTYYIFLLGYWVLFCVESLSSQSKHCTWVSPSASSQLESWVSDTSHLSQQREEGSHSSVACSISAVSLQPLAHDVWDKMSAQHTKGQSQVLKQWDGRAHPAQWELPSPRWSCACREWWPGRRRHPRAAPSRQRSSGSRSQGLVCWTHQWTCGLFERAAEVGYKAVHLNPWIGLSTQSWLRLVYKSQKMQRKSHLSFQRFPFTLLFTKYLTIQMVGPHHFLSGLYLEFTTSARS